MYNSLLIFTLLFHLSYTEFAFPEDEAVTNKQKDDKRIPLYIPGKCPVNQLYYPGDQASDWICDCAPTHVYYPPTDMCYPVYRRGPCKENEYLQLKKTQIIPECVRNPCRNDTLVPFKGKCHKLHRRNGCPPVEMGGGTIEVNHVSLDLECNGNVAELNIINVPSNCPQGSKRSTTGLCRAEF